MMKQKELKTRVLFSKAEHLHCTVCKGCYNPGDKLAVKRNPHRDRYYHYDCAIYKEQQNLIRAWKQLHCYIYEQEPGHKEQNERARQWAEKMVEEHYDIVIINSNRSEERGG